MRKSGRLCKRSKSELERKRVNILFAGCETDLKEDFSIIIF